MKKIKGTTYTSEAIAAANKIFKGEKKNFNFFLLFEAKQQF